MSNTEGKFVVKKVTKFVDLIEGKEKEMPESDLCFQNETHIVQCKYERAEEDEKYEIKPGIFTLAETVSGIVTVKMELKERHLLGSIINTTSIIEQARGFFNKLHVYTKRKRPVKRGVLLYSKPGMGKTSAIEKFCADFVTEDPGTVVLVWPTSEIEADSVCRFLTTKSEYTKECTRLVLIIEDIGGTERDGEHGKTAVDSGLLNLLDGVGVTFQLPTFIIATTNHPENLLENLADRPGRFDLMLELASPTLDEKRALLEFHKGSPLTEEERNCLAVKGAENFSIAHIEEVVLRSELFDKTYTQVVQELIDHSKRFKKAFDDKKGNLGLSN